jgi:hypothetical protein
MASEPSGDAIEPFLWQGRRVKIHKLQGPPDSGGGGGETRQRGDIGSDGKDRGGARENGVLRGLGDGMTSDFWGKSREEGNDLAEPIGKVAGSRKGIGQRGEFEMGVKIDEAGRKGQAWKAENFFSWMGGEGGTNFRNRVAVDAEATGAVNCSERFEDGVRQD